MSSLAAGCGSSSSQVVFKDVNGRREVVSPCRQWFLAAAVRKLSDIKSEWQGNKQRQLPALCLQKQKHLALFTPILRIRTWEIRSGGVGAGDGSVSCCPVVLVWLTWSCHLPWHFRSSALTVPLLHPDSKWKAFQSLLYVFILGFLTFQMNIQPLWTWYLFLYFV